MQLYLYANGALDTLLFYLKLDQYDKNNLQIN